MQTMVLCKRLISVISSTDIDCKCYRCKLELVNGADPECLTVVID